MAIRTKTGRNEQRRLLGTALNNLAVALIATGLIVPLVSRAYGVGAPPAAYWWAFALVWFVSAVAFHAIARFVVGSLEE